VYFDELISAGSAPVNTSCQRKPSVVMIKRLPATGNGADKASFFSCSLYTGGNSITRMMQVQMFFICNGFAKQAKQCNPYITYRLPYCYKEAAGIVLWIPGNSFTSFSHKPKDNVIPAPPNPFMIVTPCSGCNTIAASPLVSLG